LTRGSQNALHRGNTMRRHRGSTRALVI
jgi:hypothetical protein